MAKRSRAELVEDLKVQMRFLRSSAAAFDAGDEAEAKRLATTIRVLVHNTSASHSLLKQLGEQHKLRFLDTWRQLPVGAPGVIVHRFDWGLAELEMSFDSRLPHYKAPLQDADRERIVGPTPFRQWWNREVLRDQHGVAFTRSDLVRFLANKDGGAHVDPTIPDDLHRLSRLNSLGYTVGTEAGPEQPLGDPIPSNVRQIAFEVEHTITTQLGHLLGGETADSRA